MLTHLCDGGGDLDYMDVTQLMTELTKPWEITENPATKFARDDKIERQLIKAGIKAQPNLRLALNMSAFKGIGKYDAEIREFEAKPTAIKTFDNFCAFIINEFAKRSKQNTSTAKAVGFCIANYAVMTDISDNDIQAAEAAWAITKVANAVQAAQDKQSKCMMEMFKQMMATMMNATATKTILKTPIPKVDPAGSANNANILNSNMQSLNPNVGNLKLMPPAIPPTGNRLLSARRIPDKVWSKRSLGNSCQVWLKLIK